VEKVDGSWSDPTQTGTVTYSISAKQGADQLAGAVTLSRSASGISITLKFKVASEQFNLSYQISSYAKQ
jgi:hypothetical protein